MCEAVMCTTVVGAGVPPERVMSDFKGYASRRLESDELGLNRTGSDGTPWQHTVAVETTARLGGHSVCKSPSRVMPCPYFKSNER